MSRNYKLERTEIYIALKGSIIRLDFDYAGQVNNLTKEQKKGWKDALILRTKYFPKIIRESKTLASILPVFLTSFKALKEVNEYDLNGN